MQKSRYGNTELTNEYLIYPFNGPIKYDFNYTGTYSKYSITDKYYIDTLVKPHKRLVSGGAEWSNNGVSNTFSLTNIVYTFTGEILTYSASNPGLTLSTGHSLYNRIDSVIIDEDGEIKILEGIPSATPIKPVLSDSQLLIQYAYINANASTIGSGVQIYDNGVTWQPSTYQLSGSNSGSTTFLKIDGPDTIVEVNSDYRTGIKFTKQIGGLTASNYGSVSIKVRFDSVVPDNKLLVAQLGGSSLSGTVSSSSLNLMTYGLERDLINEWQHIVIPVSKFSVSIGTINSISLRMAGGASASNTLWQIKSITLQRGIPYDEYMGEPDSAGGFIDVNSIGVIGPAEDGTYTDGVFTDFTSTTPIGTAIDRFNELFMALVPSNAPVLSDWSGSRTGGVNGKLSFDDSNPISGSTYFGANTAPSPILVDGLWSASGKRLSIYTLSNTNVISGTLNDQVLISPTTPTPAYVAKSFGDADKGLLKMYINGSENTGAKIDLTNLSLQNTIASNSGTGFSISAATSSKFTSGVNFDTFKYRTGTWQVSHTQLRNGYNYIIVEHTSSGSFTRTLTRYELIVDHNTDETTFTNEEITTFSLTGSKYLSGINYFTDGYIKYNTSINNLYRNTYYSGSDAITFSDNSLTGNSGTNPILSVPNSYSLPNSLGNELRGLTLSTDFGGGSSLTFSVITSGKRRLNDSIGIYTTAKRTLQGTRSGGTQSISNIYLDNITADSTNYYENFNDENYRLIPGSYDLISDITSGIWDSSISLVGTYNTSLQVYNSRLIYPVTDFSSHGTSLNTNPNYGISTTNYSTASGTRTYIRWFRQISPTVGNFKVVINGSGGTFVAKSTSLTGNNIHLEFKAPTQTGWLDAYNDFATNQWTDGSGGRKSNSGAGRAFGVDWGLTIGTKSTADTSGYIVVKITVASGFTGYFDSINFTFG
jgi:hypothetical protein